MRRASASSRALSHCAMWLRLAALREGQASAAEPRASLFALCVHGSMPIFASRFFRPPETRHAVGLPTPISILPSHPRLAHEACSWSSSSRALSHYVQKMLAYVEKHDHGSWRALPAKAGLQRCGKSCKLRWTNYLRSDINRGEFSSQEEQTIVQLHALLGNRWSAIATHLPKRTKMGIDPCTHKAKSDALGSAADAGPSRSAANLSHMAQWESARLEAEARLMRESRMRRENGDRRRSIS
ncbi:hypothetical protein ZIOFF_049865 [Zingiber officinale]|uniref:Uncharacterized protein n=1 Tax=Zingiber officinale TaxID=94328 RepID=A0A8J5FKB7_ZINOF|nr:hypothetical protein ZIOFF_049865 [Zingiber officinale]